MFQSDYILRMIEQMGAMLRRILDSLRDHKPAEALEHSEEAVGLVLDVDPDTALSLTGDGLLMLMGGGGDVDPTQALLLGQVLALRAEACVQQGDDAQASREAERARIVLEVALGSEREEDVEAAREYLQRLDDLG
jgi:hypothetical protein